MTKRVYRCLQIVLMLVVAVGGVGVLLVSLAAADSDIVTTTKTLDRDLEPVIVTGAQVGALSGAPLDELFVYNYTGGAWSQIPSQVDEVTASGDYTTTEDGLLDANDEVVFMAMDMGDQAPADGSIVRDLPISGTWYEIEVTDPTEPAKKGWAYLVRSSTLTSTPTDYVDYNLGSHRIEGTTYALGAAVPEPYVGYLDPWFDYLTLNGGQDILDRTKTRLCFTKHEISCLITEQNLPGDLIEDDLIKDDAVRVIVRGGIGLAYHSMVQWTRPISWREIRVNPHTRFSIDFNEQAIGATYYNLAVPGGVQVDGIPDTVEAEPMSSWFQLSTDEGTLIQVGDTTSMGGTQTNYYIDDSANDFLDTGDKKHYGDTGVFVMFPSANFTYTFALYVLPGAQDDLGPMYEDYYWQPLSIRALIPPPDVGLDKAVIGTDFQPGDPITFTLSIANNGAQIASGVVVTDMLPSELLTPTFDSTLAITPAGGFPYVWNVQPLAPGEGGVITITGWISPDLPSPFPLTNWATIWDPEDGTPDDNTDLAIVNGYTVYLPVTLRS